MITIRATGLPANPTDKPRFSAMWNLSSVNGAVRYQKISAATGRPAGDAADVNGSETRLSVDH